MPVTEKRSNHQLQLVKKRLRLTPVNDNPLVSSASRGNFPMPRWQLLGARVPGCVITFCTPTTKTFTDSRRSNVTETKPHLKSQIGRVHDLIKNHIDIIFGVMSQWRFRHHRHDILMISMISPLPAVLFATRREVGSCGERACAGAVLNNRAAVGQSSAVCQPVLLRSAVPANAHIVGSTECL